jgi:hypothetical protein
MTSNVAAPSHDNDFPTELKDQFRGIRGKYEIKTQLKKSKYHPILQSRKITEHDQNQR